ncbi:MAG: hypothetical protein Q8934_14320 [Bacillota bacterium]|nr:hypothetical protein [Bacillota bacterium]
MSEWETLIKIFENHNCDPAYIAECVYTYVENSDDQSEDDENFQFDLALFLND